ncbi:hypothetical protein RJ641_032518 [Dillenia turbinata]|uniref:Syringolide-induced protein 14-1-1 n=1 Tax=Dillenia turbinata TaxID=194707 RepID=A0AAN8VRQ8_9MAGN
MEKPNRARSNLLKFLPKSLTFKNLQFSPGRENASNKLKSHVNHGRGFSGPIVTMIPSEIRRKSRSGRFDSQEPTSPKVSCMGQIKHKEKMCRTRSSKAKSRRVLPAKEPKQPPLVPSSKEIKSKKSGIGRIFGRGRQEKKKSEISDDQKKSQVPTGAPSLGQMRRYASGRDTLANFDWTAQVHSDEERREDDGSEEEEERESIIPFSAPILVGGGSVALEPRKQINLWKRRTMDPPKPLDGVFAEDGLQDDASVSKL